MTSETTHIGGQVATGLLYWTACRLELWVFITQNLEVGYNVDQLDLHALEKTNVGISNTCTLCSYYCT